MRYFKLVMILTLLLLTAAFASSCVDSMDINKKLIFTTVLCDRKDGEVWFYVETANIEASQGNQSGGSSGGKKYVMLKAHGKTVDEARVNLERETDQPLYISGVQTLVLTESFAKDDLLEYLYRLRGDETYRKKVITVVTREDPEKLYSVLNEQNISLGYSIKNTLETLDNLGFSFSRTTSRLLENLSDQYTGILIPCIGLQDKEVTLAGYSVVYDDAVTDFIPVEDTKGLVMLKADHAKSYFVVPYNDIEFTIETDLKNKKISVSYEEGKASYTMKLDFKAALMYGDKKTPYNIDDAAISEMTASLKETIEKELRTAVEQAQLKYKTDYLQMDDELRIRYPEEFNELSWQDVFLNATVNFDVNVDLSTQYMMDYGENKTR